MTLRRMLSRFVGIEPYRRRLLMEAALWLLLARFALAMLPFRRVAGYLGTFTSPADAGTLRANLDYPSDHARLAKDVSWAIARVASHSPFKAVCLPQAMTARIMLGRRGVNSVLHFGAARGDNKLFEAHAWLDAVGIEVTGYPVGRELVEIARIV